MSNTKKIKKNTKVEVKEIKPKVKVLKEIPHESPLEKDVEDFENEEFHDFVDGVLPATAPIIQTGQEERDAPVVARGIAPPQPATPPVDTNRLYDIGRNLGSSSQRRVYTLSDGSVRGSTLTERRAGRDFAMSTGSSLLPEGQTSGSLSNDALDREQKYSNEVGSPSKGAKKRYAWEV